ncbi:AATF family protein [Aspergillus ruber CBS 135680]|uniref:Protein BFR2 n=1 Tax=Aspergillus ruber (strain CBS 135680) TaxID=1388766 RepID=A0A017S669_ASPRC|nr:TRAUB-domain-containing protein [Aspergillus ruber CBS 135680]EYE92104.1 TRAUB-domain-containing protein [Aspergillus ruber CBS 135680]
MAPKSKSKSLAEQFAELDDPTPKDFDPEDLDTAKDGQSDDDESGESEDDDAGREHYQAVGKSKLRKPEPINLGKQYAGSKVSREALEDVSDDDPFKARSSDEEDDDEEEEDVGLEDEENEDDSEGDSEVVEKPEVKTPKKTKQKQEQESEDEDEDGMETDGSEDIDGEDGLEDDDSEDGSEDGEDDDDEEDGDEDEDDDPKPKGDDREQLRQLMATDQKSIAASISQAAKADAVKGKAVKQQRKTFDALLNTRIKLQKGLTAVSQLSVAAKDAENVDTEAIKSAESAALALWSTLEDLRYALADAQSGESKKRKRPSPVSPTTSSASLWQRMTDLETDAVAHRRTVLDKWSVKVRGSSASLPNSRGKLLGSGAAGQQTITAVLDAQLASEAGERSTKRARNANGAVTEDEPIYDDSIFYQTMLRELVEQRISSDSIANGLDTLHIQLPSKLSIHPVTGMRNDKNRRANVDTRASKGRKMRFDVHEKLQNFMAPEDRGTWTTRARDEFFASLLGRTASGMLGEGDEDDASAEESDEDREEGGLRLFRN